MKMKSRIAVLVALSMIVAAGFGFRLAANFAGAEVEQIQGMYVFIKAKPTSTYTYIGTVKGPTFSNAEFDTMLPKMIKKAKEEFPDANGLMFNGEMGSSEKWKCDAIKITE